MFDRTYVQQGPSRVSVDVEERRAPTDESVRLLREMESKAKDQVVQSLRIESCGVEAVVHRSDDPMDAKTCFMIVYKINGVQRKCFAKVDWQDDIQKRVDVVWKTLADDLASYLMQGLFKTVIGRK